MYCGWPILLVGLLSLRICFEYDHGSCDVNDCLDFCLTLCHSLANTFCSEQKMDHFSPSKFETDWMMIVFYFWRFIWKCCCCFCQFFALLLINPRLTGSWMSWTIRSFHIHCFHPRIHSKCVVSSSINNNKKNTIIQLQINVHTIHILQIHGLYSGIESALFLILRLNLPATSQVFCLSYFGCTVWINVCICYSINMVSFVRPFAHYLSSLTLSPHCLFFCLYVTICFSPSTAHFIWKLDLKQHCVAK